MTLHVLRNMASTQDAFTFSSACWRAAGNSAWPQLFRKSATTQQADHRVRAASRLAVIAARCSCGIVR
jgi:hypothetical protein